MASIPLIFLHFEAILAVFELHGKDFRICPAIKLFRCRRLTVSFIHNVHLVKSSKLGMHASRVTALFNMQAIVLFELPNILQTTARK